VLIECMLRRIYLKARQDRFNLRIKPLSGTNRECGSKRELEITVNAFSVTWITVSMVLETNWRENKYLSFRKIVLDSFGNFLSLIITNRYKR